MTEPTPTYSRDFAIPMGPQVGLYRCGFCGAMVLIDKDEGHINGECVRDEAEEGENV